MMVYIRHFLALVNALGNNYVGSEVEGNSINEATVISIHGYDTMKIFPGLTT